MKIPNSWVCPQSHLCSFQFYFLPPWQRIVEWFNRCHLWWFIVLNDASVVKSILSDSTLSRGWQQLHHHIESFTNFQVWNQLTWGQRAGLCTTMTYLQWEIDSGIKYYEHNSMWHEFVTTWHAEEFTHFYVQMTEWINWYASQTKELPQTLNSSSKARQKAPEPWAWFHSFEVVDWCLRLIVSAQLSTSVPICLCTCALHAFTALHHHRYFFWRESLSTSVPMCLCTCALHAFTAIDDGTLFFNI